jgi:3-methyladenine DNA glycosylase AlkD
MTADIRLRRIIRDLRAQASPEDAMGMAKFGIRSDNVLGIPVATLRTMAKGIGTDHALALELWKAGILEARVLALLIDDPAAVTEKQMERWAKGFDNWAICDGVCLHLFRKTPLAWKKAVQWSGRREEFVKRAGFVLMAVLAVHDKKADDSRFLNLLSIIQRESADGRNGVKKAVNWALRQIGKRNRALHAAAIREAERIRAMDSPSARWIASDALREFKGDVVRRKLERMDKK